MTREEIVAAVAADSTLAAEVVHALGIPVALPWAKASPYPIRVVTHVWRQDLRTNYRHPWLYRVAAPGHPQIEGSAPTCEQAKRCAEAALLARGMWLQPEEAP